MSYCQSRNRLMVMCMRVRLAICLANTCRHVFQIHLTPWYRFLTDLGDRSGETTIISIPRAALAIRAKQILITRTETNAPLADFQCKSQSSSGYKNGKISYCQSRNRLMVMCMRVRLAICLANTCRHSDCFRYT